MSEDIKKVHAQEIQEKKRMANGVHGRTGKLGYEACPTCCTTSSATMWRSASARFRKTRIPHDPAPCQLGSGTLKQPFPAIFSL